MWTVARLLRRLSIGLDVVAQVVAGAILLGLLIALFVSIVVRAFDIGSSSVIWIEEVSRFSFIWIGFLGTTMAFFRREHIVIDVLLVALPNSARAALSLLVELAVIVFLLVLLSQGMVFVQEAGDQTSQSLGIRLAYVQLVVPLSAAVMLVHALVGLLERFSTARQRGVAR